MSNLNTESNVKKALTICTECGKSLDKDDIFQCIKINDNFYCKECALKVRTAKTADTTKSNTILTFLKVIIILVSVIGCILSIVIGNTYKIVTVSDTLTTSTHFNYILMIGILLLVAVIVLFLYLFYNVINNQQKILKQVNKISK